MPRELVDFTGQDVVAGDPVTPERCNDIPEASEIFQEFYVQGHRASDGEHGGPSLGGHGLVAPMASAILTVAAGVYTVKKTENWKSTITTDHGVGDLSLTMECAARNQDDWFVDLAIRGNGECVFGIEYDDGAVRSVTAARVFIFDPTANAKDKDFLIDAYGPRNAGATGLGVSVPVAYDDVRNRLSADDFETAEHRNKLQDFVTAKKTQLVRKHEASGPSAGQHRDVMVPIAVALLRPNADVTRRGSVVWQAGAFDGSPEYTVDGDSGRHLIKFRVLPGYWWLGCRPCVRITTKPANPVPRRYVPRVSRPYRAERDRFNAEGWVDLGTASLDEIVSVGLVIHGFKQSWQGG